MKLYDIYVVGMRRELFIDELPSDDAFDTVFGQNERSILFCIACNGGYKFTITLCTNYGWCGSGYTTASWGNMYADYVLNDFGPATHLPRDHKIKLEGVKFDALKFDPKRSSLLDALVWDDSVDIEDAWCDIDYKTNVFTVSCDGGDSYYPQGFTEVEDGLFVECPRSIKKRPVWIFYGASGTGKSTIGNILESSDKTVYDTDSAEEGVLPEEICADVIVVGNKWADINLYSVKSRLPKDVSVIYVKFDKE